MTERFQRRAELDVDGEVGPLTRQAMKKALEQRRAPAGLVVAVPRFGGGITHGSRGAAVRAWQAQMRKRGWRIDVDGEFGEQSAEVCRKFQREKKLAVTGEVDAQTWQAAWTSPVTDD